MIFRSCGPSAAVVPFTHSKASVFLLLEKHVLHAENKTNGKSTTRTVHIG